MRESRPLRRIQPELRLGFLQQLDLGDKYRPLSFLYHGREAQLCANPLVRELYQECFYLEGRGQENDPLILHMPKIYFRLLPLM